MNKYFFDYENYGNCHVMTIAAKSQDEAERYFKRIKPNAIVFASGVAKPEHAGYYNPTPAKMFEIWKDSELGYTYHVESFNTWLEASEWMDRCERYYPGWHLRIVEI